MSDRRYITGAAVLSILAFSAFVAPSAFAEQRAYTCSSSAASKTFSDAHCVNGGGSSFGHTLIEGTPEVTGTNEKTASSTTAAAVSKLKGALSGVETELSCSAVHFIGTLTNTAAALDLHIKTIIFTNCVVTRPAGKGCVVSGGTIETKELLATTVGQAANKVKLAPASGTELASAKIEKCEIPALNKSYSVLGSLVADASGATLSTTHFGITTQNTLKFGGNKAGLEGALTASTAAGPVALT